MKGKRIKDPFALCLGLSTRPQACLCLGGGGVDHGVGVKEG